MKKFRGKALAALLSLALIASSLPVTLASASSKTVQGRLTSDPDNDEFWLVNGGTSTALRSVKNFDDLIYSTVPLETKDRETVDDIEVSSISHVSGDKLCKWDIDDDNSGDTTLSLKKSDSEGTEVIAVLYKGTYTDDDDNDITVKASVDITIHAVDKYATVIGDASKLTEGSNGEKYAKDDSPLVSDQGDIMVGNDSPELDDDFAEETMSGVNDSKTLAVFRAEPYKYDTTDEDSTNILAKWAVMKTIAKDSKNDPDEDFDESSNNGPSAGINVGDDNDKSDDVYYTLKTSNDNIELTSTTSSAANTGLVTATVIKSHTGNVTLTAEATKAVNDGADDTVVKDDSGNTTATYHDATADDDDVKVKVKIAKKIHVDTNDASFSIYDNDGDTTIKGATAKAQKIDGGFEVNFDGNVPNVSVSDDVKLDSITGKVGTLTIGGAKVDKIDLDQGTVKIDDDDAKVGDISTDGDGSEVTLSADVSVGNIDIDGVGTVTVEAGTTGTITTDGKVSISASEDDTVVSTGKVSAKEVDIDSDDGKVSVEGIVASTQDGSDDDTTITLEGDDIAIKSIDFDYYATDLTFTDFQGEIPAPVNATTDGATIETTDEDDDVTVTGDLSADSVSIEDESEMTFAGKADINNLDGSGTMYIGADKLYIGDDASGVLVKITNSDLKSGDTIFTAASDAVDEDDLDFYGFTVKKSEGSSTDTFKADKLVFAGLALNKTSDKIVLGDSATYTASAYAPGTSLPEGYSIEFDMEDNSGVFELTDNGNGTATVKTVDFDETFSDENKATLKAYLVDEDGDEDDDYAEAECDLTALKVPEVTFTSDTNNNFTLAPGASYQFKITASSAPVMTAGSAGVISSITNVGKSGNDYFIKITAAANANGKATGIYVSVGNTAPVKLLVVTVSGAQTFKSDTTAALTVKKGASYQYGITTNNGAAPTFTLGSSNVFHYELVGHNGSTYFFKVTAVGAVGAQTGVYVNGTKVNVAKVG